MPMLFLKMTAGAALGLAMLVSTQNRQADSVMGSSAKQPFTVVDAIRMTKISGTANAAINPKSDFATFSPDGKRFAIVLRRGNIERNTNDYSLLLFRTPSVFHNPDPKVLVSISSSSNDAGISDLSWLKDSDTILFLASRASEPTQLYSVHCGSGGLHRLTNSRTSITSYAVSDGGGTIVYSAKRAESSLLDGTVMRNGLHVSRESVTSLLKSRRTGNDSPILFVINRRNSQGRRIQTLDEADLGLSSSMLSPDGRYLVIKTNMSEVPEKWRQYQDPIVQQVFRRTLPRGFPTGMLHFELVDTRTGRSEVLLNSPASYQISDVLWSPDSQSVLLCGVFLPLSDVKMEAESQRRSRYVVEIAVSHGHLEKVAEANLTPIHWDLQTNVVQFKAHPTSENGDGFPKYLY
jgi:dipeptidyl aminopeptidase/acylaminoacyl peptidase